MPVDESREGGQDRLAPAEHVSVPAAWKRTGGMVAGLAWVLALAFAANPIGWEFGSASAEPVGDARAGKAKAGLCAACHGPDGISVNPLWPSLAGQHPAYLAKQIRAFRDGERVEPTMQPFVQDLTDQDVEDLAAFYAELPRCP